MATKAINLRSRHIGRTATIISSVTGFRLTTGPVEHTPGRRHGERWALFNVNGAAVYKDDLIEFAPLKKIKGADLDDSFIGEYVKVDTSKSELPGSDFEGVIRRCGSGHGVFTCYVAGGSTILHKDVLTII